MSDDTSDPKAWWESRAVVGSLISSASVLAAMFGVNVDAGAATELALGLLALAANAVAWYGRVKATRPISTKRVVPGVTLR
jgi:hypothetical protein